MTTETWGSRDRPVLIAAVAYCNEHQRVMWDDLTAPTGFDYKQVRAAFDALATAQPPYFAYSDDDGDGVALLARPTERARREVGQWPSPESVVEALLRQLVQTEQDENQSEDTRSRARKVRDALAGGGGAVITGVVTSVISGQFGV